MSGRNTPGMASGAVHDLMLACHWRREPALRRGVEMKTRVVRLGVVRREARLSRCREVRS